MDPPEGPAREPSQPKVDPELPADQALRQPLLESSASEAPESELWSVLSSPRSAAAGRREVVHVATQFPEPPEVQEAVLPLEPELDKENLLRRRDRHLCLRICCARLCCSWCCKMMVLIAAINIIFLSGPLSKPLWIPISEQLACQQCDDKPTIPGPIHSEAPLQGGLAACEALCDSYPECQAVDWYNNTRWCNLYAQPCLKPTASWDGASSYQMAVTCALFNGTRGVLIGGHCIAGIELPNTWTVVEHEIPTLLSSPRSWLCSLGVAFIYTYVTSKWLREKMRPVVSRLSPKSPWFRKAFARLLLPLLAVAAWVAFTSHEWGWSAVKEAAHGASGGGFQQMPLEQKIWFGVSLLLFLMLLCPWSRSIIISGMLSLGACIMTAFMNVAGLALSGCIDVTAATATIGGVTAAGAAEAAVATEGTAAGAAALEAGVVGDGAVGAEGAIAADTAAGGTAAAEGATAAEAAVAADAAVAAEAATMAEGLSALALCTIM